MGGPATIATIPIANITMDASRSSQGFCTSLLHPRVVKNTAAMVTGGWLGAVDGGEVGWGRHEGGEVVVLEGFGGNGGSERVVFLVCLVGTHVEGLWWGGDC